MMPLTKVTYSMIEGAVINIQDFGAVGDGVADDTTAIQAALDACKNGTVFFPVGSYKVTDTLKINYAAATGIVSTNLAGEGLGSVILWSGPNSIAVFWYEATSSLQGFFSKTRVENLHFINSGTAIDSIGVKLGNFTGPFGMNGGIQNFTVKGCKFASFDFCVWTDYESDTILIQDNVFLSYKQRAVYTPGSANVTISSNYFQSGGANSTAIYGETNAYVITGNLIQSSEIVTGGIVLAKTNVFTITGNYMEFPIGSQFAILLQQSASGYIGSNSFQGMQGNDVIFIDAASRDVNVGINFYGFFGFPISSFVKASPGARGVSVLGNQDYIITDVSISNGSPAVITTYAPGMQANQEVFFTTTGTLPTGLTAYTPYYVVNPSGLTFQVSTSIGGPAINTSSAGTGTHICHLVLVTPYDGDSSAFDFGYDNDYLRFGLPNYATSPNPGVTMARTGVINIGNNNQSAGWGFLTFNRSGVAIGAVEQSGTTGVNYATSSDYRLKENVQPMTGALAKVAALKPVTYKWKSDGSAGEGFIAHELAEVCPQAVTGKKDAADAKGNPAYQGIDPSKLVATLTAAIQELKADFDAYKADYP